VTDTGTAGGEVRAYRLGVAVAMLAMCAIPIATTGTNIAFPSLVAHFSDVSRVTLSWSLTGYSIVIAAFTLLGGQLSDRLGSSRMFAVGLALLVGSNVVSAAAPSAFVLIASRAVMGAGGALVVPASLSVILARCPEDRRTFTIGLWTAAFPIGSAVAPVTTAFLLELFSWRAVFGATAVVSGAALVLSTRLSPVPRAAPTSTGRADLVGFGAGTAAMGLVALAIVEGHSWGWTSPSILGSALGGMALLGVFIVRSLHHPNPLLDLSLFRIRSFRNTNIASGAISSVGTALWLVWPLLMTGLWGYSQLRVGLAMTPAPVLTAVGAMLASRVAARRGHRGILRAGACFLIASCAALVLLPQATPNYLTGMLPGIVLCGLGSALAFAPLNAAALVDVPRASMGQANAAFATGRFFSGAIGVASAIAVLDGPATGPLDNFDRAFALLGLFAVIGLALLLVGGRRSGAHGSGSGAGLAPA
jgi:MFS family permease